MAFDRVRELLRDALQQRKELLIDVSEVEGFDLIGLQLLIAARKSAQQSDFGFRISESSRVLDDACTLYSISPEEVGVACAMA